MLRAFNLRTHRRDQIIRNTLHPLQRLLKSLPLNTLLLDILPEPLKTHLIVVLELSEGGVFGLDCVVC